MPDDLLRSEVSRWLRYAHEDYEAAVMLRTATPRHTCMLAQQAAERAIKSLLALLDVQIPKSHDLDMLRNRLPHGWRTRGSFASLAALSYWAVESRYPSDLPDASAEDADLAIRLAQQVLDAVEHDLRDNGYEDVD